MTHIYRHGGLQKNAWYVTFWLSVQLSNDTGYCSNLNPNYRASDLPAEMSSDPNANLSHFR